MIKVGDIVKIVDVESDDHSKLGTVMRCDVLRSSCSTAPPMIEIVLSSSSIDWILESRLEVVSEVR